MHQVQIHVRGDVPYCLITVRPCKCVMWCSWLYSIRRNNRSWLVHINTLCDVSGGIWCNSRWHRISEMLNVLRELWVKWAIIENIFSWPIFYQMPIYLVSRKYLWSWYDFSGMIATGKGDNESAVFVLSDIIYTFLHVYLVTCFFFLIYS